MSHLFDRAGKDPYAEATRQLDHYMFTGNHDFEGGSLEDLYDALSNAVVIALGDVAARAHNAGVTDPWELKGLARAVAAVSEAVILAYRNEVDPEPPLRALCNDPRRDVLEDASRNTLTNEIEKTRQLETLLMDARRLPDLVDYAVTLGDAFEGASSAIGSQDAAAGRE